MSQNREETSWAYRFGGVGVLFLAGGVCSLFIFFTTSIGGVVSVIAGLLSFGMGLFLCGSTYRFLTSRSKTMLVKEQSLSPQSPAASTPITDTEPTIKTMTCPRCDATIPAKAKFCPKCGSAVSRVASR